MSEMTGLSLASAGNVVRDLLDEGILIPPIRIIEAGTIRRDIEELYLRASRKPERRREAASRRIFTVDYDNPAAGRQSTAREVSM